MNKIILLLILIPSISYAYIDPITGSVVIQAIIGTIVTGLFLIKTYWAKLVFFIKKLFGCKIKEQEIEKEEIEK